VQHLADTLPEFKQYLILEAGAQGATSGVKTTRRQILVPSGEVKNGAGTATMATFPSMQR
jgi:hypothetical protein